MLTNFQTWWQDATPETRAAVWDAGVAVAAFLGGLILGGLTARILRSWHFDGAFGLTYAPPPGVQSGGGFTPTRAVAMLVRLTAWGAAVWCFPCRYARADVADTLYQIGTRVWMLTALLSATLILASLLARRVVDCLQSPTQGWNGAATSRNG